MSALHDDLAAEVEQVLAGAEVDPALRRARITWASEIEPEPVVWSWEEGGQGRIPAGSLSMAAGREGTGKSSFGIWLAAQITKGLLPGSFFGSPRSILYVAVEDSWRYTLVPRLIAAGADLSRVGRFEVVNYDNDDVILSLPRDNALLEDAITEHQIALVVIDPLMSVIAEKIDTHREREVRSALDPLAKMADRTGSVLLGIAHFNKGASTDAASLITGSGAFKNVPRSVFGFARDDTDDQGNARVMSQVKNSLGRDDLPSLSYVIETALVETKKGPATTGRFAFTGTSDRSVADVLRGNRNGPEEHDERMEATAWLIDYLTDHDGQAPATDVFKAGLAVGFGKDALKRAKGRRVTSVKAGMTGGWVWQLSTEESTKSAKGVGDETLHSSPPSALPSPPDCKNCGQPLDRASQLTRSETCTDCERATLSKEGDQ